MPFATCRGPGPLGKRFRTESVTRDDGAFPELGLRGRVERGWGMGHACCCSRLVFQHGVMDEGARERFGFSMAALTYCFAHDHRAPSTTDLERLERRFLEPIPEPYRTFLGHYGNTYSAAGTIGFDVSDREWVSANGARHGIEVFLGFSTLEQRGIEHELASFGGRIRAGNLPIASTLDDDVVFLLSA